MRQNISPKHRKVLASRIGKAFEEDTRILSKEMRGILADDLVTAFFNRLNILTRAMGNQDSRGLTIQCSNDTLEMVHGNPREG